MKQITLTQGKFALVDDEDFEYLNQYKWYHMTSRTKEYACSKMGGHRMDGKIFYMHRIIMKPPDDMEIDHWDGNGLNNMKENLRICTHSENMKNRKSQKTGF